MVRKGELVYCVGIEEGGSERNGRNKDNDALFVLFKQLPHIIDEMGVDVASLTVQFRTLDWGEKALPSVCLVATQHISELSGPVLP